ncbi:hypothetical protein M885DRAFT_612182 [Pelagophyceae sp. CCMP2097]|nr:hypothetical protein M885DRAFT_612182 [Pelagophyceae sp. CCMP2097]
MEALHATLLAAADGGGGAARASAEQQLAAMEKACGAGGAAEGYVSALLAVISAASAAPAARLMGAICVRNVANRRWKTGRRGGDSCVADGEKAAVRLFAVNGALREADGLVWAQLLELARKLARQDWPRSWPGALEAVFEKVDERRGLNALAVLVKELSRKVLPVDRRAFSAAALHLFSPCRDRFRAAAAELQRGASGDRAALEPLLEAALHWLNAAARLAIDSSAFDQLAAQGDLDGFFEAVLGLERVFSETPLETSRLERKLRKRLCTVARDGLRRHADVFGARFAAPFLQLAADRVVRPSASEPLLSSRTVARLELLALAVDASQRVPDGAARDVARQFVQARAQPLARWLLVESGALALSAYELDEWEEDPEEHASRSDEGGAPEASGGDVGADADGARALRGAAEALLLSLVQAEPALAATVAAAAFGADAQTFAAALGHPARSDALRRGVAAHDSALRAAGICASAVVDAVPEAPACFSAWCRDVAAPVLRGLRDSPAPEHAAVRRRLYWLARCWAFVLAGAADERLAVCVEAVRDSGAGDVVLRMSAVQCLVALSVAGSAWPAELGLEATRRAFDLAAHLEDAAHVQAAIDAGRFFAQRALQGLNAAQGTDAERCAVAAAVFQAVPQLLERAAAASAPPAVYAAILRAAKTALVAGRSSPEATQLCVGLVSAFGDAGRDAELCCGQPAAELWLEVLQSAEAADAPLLALVPLLAPLVEAPRDLELGRHVAALACAYAALGAPGALRCLAPLVAQVSARANRDVDRALEMALIANPDAARALVDSPQLLRALAASSCEVSRTPDATIAQHLAVLARMLLLEPAGLEAALGDDAFWAVVELLLRGKGCRADGGASCRAAPAVAETRTAPEQSERNCRGETGRVVMELTRRRCYDAGDEDADESLVAHRAKVGALALLAVVASGSALARLDDVLARAADAVRLCAAAQHRGFAGGAAAHLARAPRLAPPTGFAGDGDGADGDARDDEPDDDAGATRLDAVCAWRVGHDAVAAADVRACARESLAGAAAKVGEQAVRDALATVEPNTLAQLGLS